MSMFRRQSREPREPRKPRQSELGPKVLQLKVRNSWLVSTEVEVAAIEWDRPQGLKRVYLYLGDTTGDRCVAPLAEDEARELAQALLQAIEQSKAMTVQEPG